VAHSLQVKFNNIYLWTGLDVKLRTSRLDWWIGSAKMDLCLTLLITASNSQFNLWKLLNIGHVITVKTSTNAYA